MLLNPINSESLEQLVNVIPMFHIGNFQSGEVLAVAICAA